MPMPWTYRHASKEWRAFLDDVKDSTGLESDNMAYTAIDAVFQVFRRRLTAEQGLRFASTLPAVPRAIFVKDWRPEAKPPPFPDPAALIREVRAVRPDHNLTPDNAIEATARALRRSIDQRDLDDLLADLPPGAQAYWHVAVDDPSELRQRII